MCQIGRKSYTNNLKVTSHPDAKLVIGNYTSIGPDVRIGNDVWIGYGATIMSGVTIGDGAVIAANSHVVKHVKPYEIVGGNPAKHIKFRFDIETIGLLLAIKWWNLPESEVNKLIPILTEIPDKAVLKGLCKSLSPS
jgi:acetyltransferase-like isoleucine patch superfamily enzyme